MKIDWDSRIITLHQSDLGTFFNCPEQLRASYVGLRVETDAANVGTGLHAAIESEKRNQPFDSPEQMAEWAVEWFDNELRSFDEDGIPFVFSSFENIDRCYHNLEVHSHHYYNCAEREQFLHADALSEWSFDVTMGFHEINGELWEIRLAGQADWVHADRPMKDWKTSSQEYKRWEKQRWAQQPTVYLKAAEILGIPIATAPSGDYIFEFKVFRLTNKQNEYPETVTVYRGARHFAWLEEQVLQVVNYVITHNEHTSWLKNDSHVLCSPKWCPNWFNCKGQFIDEERW